MIKEINRSYWSRFLKKFNSENQYRNVRVKVFDRHKKEVGNFENFPFIGTSIEKKGRLIDGVQVFTGRADADYLSEPLVSLKAPSKLIVENEKKDQDCLKIFSKDGSLLQLFISGEKDPNHWVEKVAYNMFEKRGYSQGNDQADWYEAERRVKECEKQFVS